MKDGYIYSLIGDFAYCCPGFASIKIKGASTSRPLLETFNT